MKTYESVESEDLGTVFIQGKGGRQEQKNTDTSRVYLRRILTEYKSFDPPRTGIFFLREVAEDLGYIEVDGNDFVIDFDKAGNRTYQIVLIGKKPTTVTIPQIAITAGYPWGKDAKIQVHEGQIVALKITQTFLGSQSKWLVEVDGETDGVITKIKLSENGEEYEPNPDGTITLPIKDLLREVEEACKKYADDNAVLYWND
jgi:hypothetical protein